jgi:hypothetical protein
MRGMKVILLAVLIVIAIIGLAHILVGISPEFAIGVVLTGVLIRVIYPLFN